MLGLERTELVQQPVVLVVADRRVVVVVVGVIVAGDLRAQLADALLRARRCRHQLASGSTPAASASRSHDAEPLELAVVGEVEVDRGDRDPAAGDRGEIGAALVLERRLEAIDLVAPPSRAVLFDQLQLVVVEPLAEPRQLDPADLARGAVDVDQRPRRHRLGDQLADDLAADRGRHREVELAAGVAHATDARLLGDGDGGQPEHQPLERRRHGARVGDVVAEVGAVVDPRDDQVGTLAEQAEVGEAHAVDRGALGREADRAVVELDLLDPDRRPVVMLRAVPLRFVCGATTRTSTPSIRSSSRRRACSPRAPIPSSLVSRTIIWQAEDQVGRGPILRTRL